MSAQRQGIPSPRIAIRAKMAMTMKHVPRDVESSLPKMKRSSHHSETSHDAPRVRDISRDGWKKIFWAVKHEIEDDRLTMVAGGVAFYGFLALFPALAATISVWGLIADPTRIREQIVTLQGALPASAIDLLTRAAHRIASTSSASLSGTVIFSLLFALWSSNKGMKGLIEGVSIAYDEPPQKRGLVATNGLSFVLTLGAILLTLVTVALVVGTPIALDNLGLDPTTKQWLDFLRWPLLALMIGSALAIIYRVAPPRPAPRWRWVTPGAVLATFLWLIASSLFSYYTRNFGNYDKTYGSLAAVAVLLMWFLIGAFIVLLGAELNSESERQIDRERAAPDSQMTP